MTSLKKQKEEFDSAFTQLQKHITRLKNEKDDLDRYSRRVCQRIEDVPVANEETAEDVFKKTENLLKKDCIDRTHRFQYQTLIDRKRDSLKKVGVKIDLTKRGYEVLKNTITIVSRNNNVDYVFTKVTCRLKVAFKDKRSSFFNDIDNLKKLLEDRIS